MIFRFIFGFYFMLFSVTASFTQKEELARQIELIIKHDTQIAFDKTPGILISVIDGDSIWHIPFGFKDLDKKDQLSKFDIFEFGSISKVFTSSLIDVLQNEEKIDVNDFVNNFIPIDFQNPRLDSLKLLDLINHNSHLPRRPSFFGKSEKDPMNPYEYYSNLQLLEFYRDYIPDNEEFFVYSHTNYALLEYIIENVTNRNFGDVLEEKIFKPLGMLNSFIDFKENRTKVLTPGFDRAMRIAKPWTFNSFKGSEALKSSNNDICKFILANLNNSKTELDSLFANNFDGRSVSFNERLFISQGWHIIQVKDKNIITHSGKTSGHTTFIGFVRKTNTGVVVSCNSAYGSEDLGMLILRMINFNWDRKY